MFSRIDEFIFFEELGVRVLGCKGVRVLGCYIMQNLCDSGFKVILNLLGICEEMLFSISLKTDIVKKYESMRGNVFGKLGIQDDFKRFWECQVKAQEQARQKKSFLEMERKILKNTIEEQNGWLTRTLETFSSFTKNFKSNSEEAGNQDLEQGLKLGISVDITKYTSELQSFESILAHLSNHQAQLQKQCKIQQDSLNTLSQENLKIKTSSDHLQKSYEESIKILESTYQAKISQISKHSMTESKKLNDLEMSFHAKEVNLIDQLDKLTLEDASVLKDLREKLEKSQKKSQELRTVLKAVNEKIDGLFNEFIDKEEISQHFAQRKSEIFESRCEKTWGDWVDLFVQIDFVGYGLYKLKGDNDWLVEQLDGFCKENEELKDQLRSIPKKLQVEKAFKTLNTNEIAVKDFTEARNKLVMQFKECSLEFE